MAFKYQASIDELCAQVFAALYSNKEGLTREQLSKQLNTSKPTVKKGLVMLQDKGLVIEAGKVDTEAGRRPRLYRLNASENYWIGIDMEIPDLGIGLYDLNHELVKNRDKIIPKSVFEEGTGPGDFLTNSIKEIQQAQSINLDSVMGIGVAAPGIVKSGKFTPFSRQLDGREYDLKSPLEENFSLPVNVGNDVDLELISEIDQEETLIDNRKTIAYLAVRRTKDRRSPIRIGGAIFYNGQLYRSSQGSAGEFGHTSVHLNVEEDLNMEPLCGNPRCLETYVNTKLKQSDANDPIPPEIPEAIKHKLIDITFTFTPNQLIVDMSGLPSLAKPIINETKEFVRNLIGRWEHNHLTVKQPVNTKLSALRGAAINSMRDLLSAPSRYSNFPTMD